MTDNLIERYLAEVSRLLPSRQSDVQLELRSALQDALDERGLDPDKESDQPEVVKLLKEFGSPRTVAKGYGQRSFLMRPALQPMYWRVLRLLAFLTGLGQLVELVRAANAGAGVSAAIGGALTGLANGFVWSFAIVTLLFALMDRILPYGNSGEAIQTKEDWDPKGLPALSLVDDRVNLSEAGAELAVSTALLVAANALPHISFSALVAGFAAQFFTFIPAITILAGAQGLLRVWLITQGRWATWLRWADWAGDLGWVSVLIAMSGAAPFSENTAVDNVSRFFLGLMLVLSLIKLSGKFLLLVKRTQDKAQQTNGMEKTWTP